VHKLQLCVRKENTKDNNKKKKKKNGNEITKTTFFFRFEITILKAKIPKLTYEPLCLGCADRKTFEENLVS